MISDLSLCNQFGQKTSHSFQFEDSYESLCYEFYLQDIEEQNLRLKTERIEPPVKTYIEDIKHLTETQRRINCSEYESTNIIPTLGTPTLNTDSHSEDSLHKEEGTDKAHTEEEDFSDSRTDVSITLNTSQTKTLNKPFEEEPID